MKQHAKRASWAEYCFVPTLLLGSASMVAFLCMQHKLN